MAEQLGYGIHLPYEELTADKLRDAIKRILIDPRFELIQILLKFNRNSIGIQLKIHFRRILLTKIKK